MRLAEFSEAIAEIKKMIGLFVALFLLIGISVYFCPHIISFLNTATSPSTPIKLIGFRGIPIENNIIPKISTIIAGTLILFSFIRWIFE